VVWNRKHVAGLIIVVVVIAVFAVYNVRRTPTKATLLADEVITNSTQPSLTSGTDYNIVGDITVGGMNVHWDRLNAILEKRTDDGEKVYKYLLINGNFPEKFAEEVKQAITPHFFAKNTGEMCVWFDIVLGDTTRKIKVKTDDSITTLAYYLAIKNSKRVVYRVGEPRPSMPASSDKEVFKRHVSYTIGDTKIGTPYNFVPLPSYNPNIPKINPEYLKSDSEPDTKTSLPGGNIIK